jgi:hypothetical protein
MMINREQESHCYIRENGQRDAVIGKLDVRIGMVESRLKQMKQHTLIGAYFGIIGDSLTIFLNS